MLVDLLTVKEHEQMKSQKVMGKYPGIVLNKFNIHLLSTRLTAITNWIVGNNGLELAAAGLEHLYIAYTFKKLIFTNHHIEVDPMEKLIAYI